MEGKTARHRALLGSKDNVSDPSTSNKSRSHTTRELNKTVIQPCIHAYFLSVIADIPFT